ncbi:hypothetical protein Tsubulata_005728 [Turnera subulata]|uniref:DUF761 domain-containing protein n=1 Tax=Turnera subulata TaxID=218843 RepID=A0A9Q0JLR8_9ROSI|nr:hypothetical protein Tsubulata_005728 [Turnera subulata]
MDRQEQQNWSLLLGHLKKAAKKINFLLNLNIRRRWHLASTILRNSSSLLERRRLSFNDRLGLHGCIEEDVESEENKPVVNVQRTRSTCCASSSSDEDIDERAEVFIANFRRQLLMERQVSLKLRYHRGNSFD